MDVLVTTSYAQEPAHVALAHQLADEFGGVFVPRGKYSLERLRRRAKDIVVVGSRIDYYPDGSEDPFFHHPSMGYIRARRILEGRSDPLALACRLSPGDTVLDATLGLGADALVLSVLTGSSGRVVACESHPIVGRLTQLGLAALTCEYPEIEKAARRIDIHIQSHDEFLASCANHEMDVVYFDPMFRESFGIGPGIGRLKRTSDHRALTPDVVGEARRVASRRVVLKERVDSGEFDRLGFTVLYTSGKIGLGVIDV